MRISETKTRSAEKWFRQQAMGLNALYEREMKRRSTRCHGHVRRTPYKSEEWCNAISAVAAAYRFAAQVIHEMPLEVPELIRGPVPYDRAIRARMDRRAAYIAKVWDDLGHTKEADAALRAAYYAFGRFYLVE